MKATVSMIVAALLAAPAAAEDLHALWDGQCGGCHGHAGDFARQSLELRDGALFGQVSGRPVAEYLIRHNGGYAAEQIAALQAMLIAQAGTPPEFQVHCGQCHDSAAQLVRDWVTRRDGGLVARGSGLPLETFLRRHGGADADSRARIIEALTRVAAEVNHR